MKFCLIGEKLSHSYSKEIHEYLGLDYTLKEIVRCGVGDFVTNSSYKGFNVTIPYKKDVIPYLDQVSSVAKEIGAVNTVVNKNGKLYGYNTDVGGILYTLERKGVNLSGKRVLILGTGGASKAVEYVCKTQGANYTFVSRNGDVNYQNCYDIKGVEVIINATPVGMYPLIDECPVNLEKFDRLQCVIDLIYNPQKTLLIKKAEELNLICSNGLPMLVEQALLAQDIWLDKKHLPSLTEEIILKLSGDKLNLALIGMPGAGKTTVGKELAVKLNKKFIDLDEEIKSSIGKSPAEIILSDGEERFREIETQVLKNVLLNSNAVISLGGGAVIKQENRRLLGLNAITVYIKRDLSSLGLENRPISKDKGVEKLFAERKPYYESADIWVDNNGAINDTLKEIVLKYEATRSKWT